jgi:hypothetical protein
MTIDQSKKEKQSKKNDQQFEDLEEITIEPKSIRDIVNESTLDEVKDHSDFLIESSNHLVNEKYVIINQKFVHHTLFKRPNIIVFIFILLMELLSYIFGLRNKLAEAVVKNNIDQAINDLRNNATSHDYNALLDLRIVSAGLFSIVIQVNYAKLEEKI